MEGVGDMRYFLLQWEFAPSLLLGMSDTGSLVDTLWYLTVVICLFYLDILDCCIPW